MNTEKLETAGTDQAGGPPGKSASGLNFPVIGIGASAGGIPALLRFFEHMPGDSGMAFVIVLHLSPKHESRADQILQRVTNMPVLQVLEPTPIEANTVYVISPSNELSMIDGFLNVTKANRPRGRPVAIDLFFRSLADDHRERAISIVMSGSGSDGALGIGRIKEQAGVAIVPVPRRRRIRRNAEERDRDGAGRPRAPGRGDAAKADRAVEQRARHPAARPRRRKPAGPRRERRRPRPRAPAARHPRHAARPHRPRLPSLQARDGAAAHRAAHAGQLARGPARIPATSSTNTPRKRRTLLRDMLIGVTNFFRDRDAFEALRRDIVPSILEGKQHDEQVRVWVPGCSTGEEAYSLAMLLCRQRSAAADTPPVLQIFATDIDERAINVARAAAYPDSIVADVPSARLRRFFTKTAGRYHARQATARKGAVRDAQPPARSAVLAARPGLVPQPAHLSGPRDPAPGAARRSTSRSSPAAISSSAVRNRRRSPTNSSRRSTRRTASIARGAH